MPYTTAYQIRFKNCTYNKDDVVIEDGDIVDIMIYPASAYQLAETDLNIIVLTPSDTPLVISIINNDQDKFSVIRSKQAKIEFKSDANTDITDFIEGGDNLSHVDILLNPDTSPITIFTGKLMYDDLLQPFQPNPQTVTLYASDHLGILKDIALTDAAGDYMIGKYSIAIFLANALLKTGLSLDIYVANNVREAASKYQKDAEFASGANTITVFNSTLAGWFWKVGAVINVTNTTNNNIQITVTDTNVSGPDLIITVAQALVTETASDVIFEYNNYHLYNNTYLDAKTFEKEIGESEDCATVIEKILGEDCFITQYLGRWYIIRVDEIDDNDLYFYRFGSDGVFGEFIGAVDVAKSIGADEDFRLALADALLSFIRPHGFVRENYYYRFPLETPCNNNWVRGAASVETLTGYTLYDIDCWDLKNEWGSFETAPTTTAHIAREFDADGDEVDRFAVILQPPSPNEVNYIRSDGIPINVRDKFSFNLSYHALTDNNTAGSTTVSICLITLYGDDGNIYSLRGDEGGATEKGSWNINVVAGSPLRTEHQWQYDASDIDLTEEVNYSVDSFEAPVSGVIYIHLFSGNLIVGNADNYDMVYRDMTFTYKMFVDGSWVKNNGQYHRIERQPDMFLANRVNEVFISDAPGPLCKGAMFKANSDSYIGYEMCDQFYDASKIALGVAVDADYHTFGYIQAFAVWNQFKRTQTILRGSVLGIGTSWVELIHRLSLTDSHDRTNNRNFLLISYEQNWKTAFTDASTTECFHTAGKEYSDTHTFKYIAQNE